MAPPMNGRLLTAGIMAPYWSAMSAGWTGRRSRMGSMAGRLMGISSILRNQNTFMRIIARPMVAAMTLLSLRIM